MKKSLGVLVVLLFLAGCNQRARNDKAYLGQITHRNELAAILEGSSGRDFAAVKADLDQWLAKAKPFFEEIDSIRVTEKEMKRLDDKFEAQLNAAEDRLGASIDNLQGDNAVQIRLAVLEVVFASGMYSEDE